MATATENSIERSSVIISVFSTTPGIGKTITAINLAAGLAREGYKVCLADLDLLSSSPPRIQSRELNALCSIIPKISKSKII